MAQDSDLSKSAGKGKGKGKLVDGDFKAEDIPKDKDGQQVNGKKEADECWWPPKQPGWSTRGC